MGKEHTNQESQLVNVGQDDNRPSLKRKLQPEKRERFLQVHQSEQKKSARHCAIHTKDLKQTA